jgi:WD40 repeat protein
LADPFSQLSSSSRGRKPVVTSSKKTLVISVVVALHVIPIAIIVLFLTGVLHFNKPADPEVRPEVVIVKTTPTPPKPVDRPKVVAPKPPEPPANTWDLPVVLPPAGMEPLIISGPNPPRLVGGAALPAKMAPLVRDFEMKHVGPVHGLAILPDGKHLLSAGADRHIRVWDTETAKQVKVFDGTPHVVRSLTINGFGNVAATGGDDGAVRVWDVALGREAFPLLGHEGPVRAVAFSPNGGYILSGGGDGTLRLWDLQTRQMVRNLKVGQPVTCVAFCADGRRGLAGGANGTIAIFDLEAAKPLHTMTGHNAAVTAVAFSPDGREAVSVGGDKMLHLWDVVTGARLPIGGVRGVSAIVYAQPLQAVAYAGDGSWVVAAVADSSAAVVQTHGKGRAPISLPPLGKPLALAVATDGSAVYLATDQGAVRRMDLQGGPDFFSTSP